MTEAAREARNAYRREWYRQNPDKRREYEARYWDKVANGGFDQKKTEEDGRQVKGNDSTIQTE